MARSPEEIMAEINQLKQMAAQRGGQKSRRMVVLPKVKGMEITDPESTRLKNELELEQAEAEQAIKPPAGDIGGRFALARESLAEIPKIREALFPGGTPESFDRPLATGSNIRGLLPIPFLKEILPGAVPNIPFMKKDDEYANKAQNLNRRLGTTLSGRQLIQTGVAARPEETEKLIEQFAPSGWSGEQSAFEAIKQLEDFYKDYLDINDPAGVRGLNPTRSTLPMRKR